MIYTEQHPYKVVVTGSRHWTDRRSIEVVLRYYTARYPYVIFHHGDCPTGADAIADSYIRLARCFNPKRIQLKTHPAQWDLYGKSAGHRRNREMAYTYPHVVLAFLLEDRACVGTHDMLRQAEEFELSIRRFVA